MNSVQKICSPFTFRQKLIRLIWNAVWLVAFRPSPRICFGWRRMILRAFGARIEPTARVYNSTRIWLPANLRMEACSQLAENVDCYNVALVTLEQDAIVSQYSYLCTASHDIHQPDCPLVIAPIKLERKAWVAAKAILGMGVVVGEGGVVALGALAIKNVDPWTVVGGMPAKPIGKRQPH